MTAEQESAWRIRYASGGHYAGRVVVPIDEREGFVAARAIDPVHHTDRYRPRMFAPASPLFGGEHTWTGGDAVVVVEGVFDAMAIERLYPGLPVAAQHAPVRVDEAWARLLRFRRIGVMTDADDQGDVFADRIGYAFARLSAQERLTRLRLPFPHKDPADAPRAVLEAALRDFARRGSDPP